jgi:hypothetical protein
LIDIYQISLFSSSLFESTEGIFIFPLTTSVSRGSISQALKNLKTTFVPAGHFILSTASYKFKSSSSIPFASIKISHFNNQNSFAGEPFNILSISTQSSTFSTTAHIHSKSQDKAS